MIGCYCRVSTQEQSLDRQKLATSEYARDHLDADLGDLEFYPDKSTGTNTSRKHYRRLMADVEAGEIEAVVVNSISRIARSIRDLDRTAERIRDAGGELHIINESMVLRPDDDDPYQNAMFRLLGVFAELEAEMAQQRTREGIAARREDGDYHHGRTPLGFDKEDGQLIPGENYDQVATTLDMVQKDDLSKRAAAKELGTSRATIDRALDRATLYGL